MDILVGSTLGGYRLTRLLGSGGMGAVYLAEDPSIGQQVAMKVIRADGDAYSDSQGEAWAADRFRLEARAVASLDHLHILPLYRYGEDEAPGGRRAYMVMQYRPEGSLWDWLRRRAGVSSAIAPALPEGLPSGWPLSLEEAADYLRQAASALQYAHDQGIVHRDIKPANFLLRFDQNSAGHTGHHAFLLLSDFGLAKFFSTSSATTQVFGTPTYMAPEQFEGIVGPESDQYALAVMIYYFLAGHPPFEGEPMRLMHQHLSATPPPIRSYAPQLAAGVEQVLARALAKKPAERYPSVMAFAEAFAQYMYANDAAVSFTPRFSLPAVEREPHNAGLPDASSSPTIFSPTPSPLYPPVQSGPLSGPTEQMMRASAPLYAPTMQSNPAISSSSDQTWGMASGPISQPTVSSSGKITPLPETRVNRRNALGWLLGGVLIVGVGVGTGAYLYLSGSVPGQGQRQGPVPGPGQTPSVKQTSTAHNAIKYVLRGHTGVVASLSWSPDGTQLASGSYDSTARLWLPGSQSSALTFTGHKESVFAVAWNPDGTLIASGGRDESVQVWTTDGTARYSFSNQGAAVDTIAWSLTGSRLVIGTQGNGARNILLSQRSDAPLGAKSIVRTVAFSPDGGMLAIGAETGFVGVFEWPSLRRLLYRRVHNGHALALAWSPDGTRLASGGSDKVALVLDVSSDRVIRTLAHEGTVNGVAWEPGSTGRLATASSDGSMRIWEADGNAHTAYNGHAGGVTSIAWSTGGLATGSTDAAIIIWNI